MPNTDAPAPTPNSDVPTTLEHWTPEARAERGDTWLLAHCKVWGYATDVPRCDCTNRLVPGDRALEDLIADGQCIYCDTGDE